MKPCKEKPGRLQRCVKTLFFLVSMFFSLLLISTPVLLALIDALLPSALFSPFSTSNNFPALLANYDFRVSVVDIPLISIFRSIIIICVYFSCDGRRRSNGLYLAITILCSLLSSTVVVLKACMFLDTMQGLGPVESIAREPWTTKAMFLSSLVLALGHIVVAYRTSCRERRKLLVYRIDLEALYALDTSFTSSPKFFQMGLK